MSNLDVAVLVGARARQRARGGRLALVFDRRSAPDEALTRTGLHGSFHTTDTTDDTTDTTEPVLPRSRRAAGSPTSPAPDGAGPTTTA